MNHFYNWKEILLMLFKLMNSKLTNITISIGNKSTFYPGVNFLNLFFF